MNVLTRCTSNPILTARDIPYDATLVFNAGVVKYQGKYVMAFRNDFLANGPEDYDAIKTNIDLAFSDDGIRWTPTGKSCCPVENDEEIIRTYDPRLTVIDGKCYMCFAVDTKHGLRGGVAVTEDFDQFEILSMSAPDNRNMVLFPERINGKYCRFERPMSVYGRWGRDEFDLWYADSPDLKYWGNNQLVLGSKQVPFSNAKIGPGAPPIKTDRGWLATFHSVFQDPNHIRKGWEKTPWDKRYDMGLILLDLDKPWKVIGMSDEPILQPVEAYEIDGYRGSVLFPGGMILEEDGEVKIYYGAADTVEALATAHVDDLLALCKPQ